MNANIPKTKKKKNADRETKTQSDSKYKWKQKPLSKNKRHADDNLDKVTAHDTLSLYSGISELIENTNAFLKKRKHEHEIMCSTPSPKNDFKKEDFTILGVDQFENRKNIKRVLPYWLANPTVVSSDLKNLTTLVTDVQDINLDIINIMKSDGITHFFPVQSAVIPWLLNSAKKSYFYRPNDVCVSAPTGSGKTLVYVIPIIQALFQRVVPQVRALVILPVCELALQVYNVFKHYSSSSNLKVVLLNGENPFHIEQKLLVKSSELYPCRNLADIVVTTPGCLVSHLLNTPGFSLKYLQYLVIDEADRLIRDIHSEWLFHIEKHLNTSINSTVLSVSTLEMFPRPPQKLLFSATLSQDPEKLSQLSLFEPKLFTSVGEYKNDFDSTSQNGLIIGDFIGKFTTPAELLEKYCVINIKNKPLALYYLIVSNNLRNVLCFTNSCVSAHRLTLLLSFMSDNRFSVGEISGSLKHSQRRAIFNDFSAGNVDVLISTDSLARGIDIPNVTCVISYDTPSFVKNYIHRIGRTGRAGRSGTAISLLLPTQSVKFLNMLKEYEKIPEEIFLPEIELKDLEGKYQTALKKLELKLIKEKKTLYRSVKKERVKSLRR